VSRILAIPFLAASFLVPHAAAQAIIAQTSGLANPGHVIDFGANLFPNFTPVTTQFPGITVSHASYYTTGMINNLVGGFLTNIPNAPQPNTLRIVFAAPITDLTFVYHQIGTTGPSTFRAMMGPAVVYSFSYTWNQSQPNNYFGFTGLSFDTLEIDFVSDFNVDTLAFNSSGQASCTVRNGNGINPSAYSCTTLPVMGTNWQSTIATTPNTIGTFLAFAPGGPSAPVPLLGGEVLVQINPAPILISGTGSYSIAIPTGPSWLGFPAYTQGLRVDAVGPTQTFRLLNAIDLVIGL
jgi:hypothetical protein